MNKPLQHPIGASNGPEYSADIYGWAMAQAQMIRARRIDLIDWDNVAEEIEDMGKSEWRATQSALRVALMHQLKWTHQPLYRSRSWANSIAEHLRRFDRSMAQNPGLKPHLPEILEEAYREARHDAAQETGFVPETFPETPPSWGIIRAPLET